MTQAQKTIVVAQKKSMGIALILTILFGPLGLLYASVGGGLLLVLFGVVVGFFTLGAGAILAWGLSIVWAIFSVSSHNGKISKMTG